MKHLRNNNIGRWGLAAMTVALCLGTTQVATAKRGADTVSCRVELDRAVLPSDRNLKAVIKVTLDGEMPNVKINRPAVNLCIVLDRSGSMSGTKLEQAKDAAIEALHRLSPRDMFSLVVYDSNVQTIVPAQSAGNTRWIEQQIRALRSGGSTALFGGVSQGAAEIRKHNEGNYVNRVILLSDGQANVGPANPSDLGRLGAGLIKEGISVSTIGVGTGFNEDLMTQLAQKSDGNMYFVENSRDLARIFNQELGDVLSIVAKRIKLTIECEKGVEPISIIGREGRIRGRNVELYLNQLYDGQEKFALLEVNIPPSGHGSTKNLAVAHVSYENPFTNKKESAHGKGSCRFSRDAKEVDSSANVYVQRAYYINMNALSQDEAISLADEGKIEEAADVLRESASKLRVIGSKFKDKELLKKADQMDDDSAELKKEKSMSNSKRKAIQSDSYLKRNQQKAY